MVKTLTTPDFTQADIDAGIAKGQYAAGTTPADIVLPSDWNGLNTEFSGKQATLVSGTNIKTINSFSLLGSGNIATTATWGSITGTLSSQTDLQTALNAKAAIDNPAFTTAITTPVAKASTSAGMTLEASNGTDIGILGAGNTANVEWYGSHNFDGATANTISAFVGAGKTLSSLATATYPSLTELAYVKGVTSAIQTQLNAKFTLPSLTTGSVLFSNGTTIAQDNANLFWDDTNNRLGVGTTSPDYPLEVETAYAGVMASFKNSNSSFGAQFQLESAATGGKKFILVSTPGGNTFINGGSFGIYDATSNAYRFAIDTSGNAYFGSLIGGALTTGINVSMLASGNVGIGITAPTARLHIVGSGATSATNALAVHNSTGSNNSLIVRNDGNIGIGTSSPGAQLQINRPSGNPSFWLSNGNITHPFTAVGFNPEINSSVIATWAGAAAASGGFQLNGFNTSSATSSAVQFIGYLGSTSPTVAAVSIFGFKSNGSTGRAALTGTEKVLSIFAGTTEIASVTGGGNAGLGITAPTAVLHLKAGTAAASTAPLKFTTGTNLTTPEAGVFEYNNTPHFTNSDATRRNIVLSDGTYTAGLVVVGGKVKIRIGGTDYNVLVE